MMSKTHLTMGMATSLAVALFATQPQNLSNTLVALAGGAIGGVLADVDTVNNDYKHDALIGQLLGFGMLALATVIDYYMKLGMCDHVLSSNIVFSIVAGIAFFAIYIAGFISEHRTFTHSLLAMGLFSGCFALVFPRLGLAVLIGYVSHLLLDLLNKKDVPLLYPYKKGICFKLCYASKTANLVFMLIGFIVTFGLLVYRQIPYIFH